MSNSSLNQKERNSSRSNSSNSIKNSKSDLTQIDEDQVLPSSSKNKNLEKEETLNEITKLDVGSTLNQTVVNFIRFLYSWMCYIRHLTNLYFS